MELKYIRALGVELEGCWAKDQLVAWSHGGWPTALERAEVFTNRVGDGSVNSDGVPNPRNIGHTGEVNSSGLIKSVALMRLFIESAYPVYVNKSCGLHVHVSFAEDKGLGFVLNEDFWQDYQVAMRELADRVLEPDDQAMDWFDRRYEGGNQYCEPRWRPDYQLRSNDRGRYAHLNFCAIRKHGTLENRLFPMVNDAKMAADLAAGYVEWLEGWLRERDTRPELEYNPEPVRVESAQRVNKSNLVLVA